MIASQNGHLGIVEMLLGAGARATISNDFGDTALHKAPVRVDNPRLIKALAKAGANVDAAVRKKEHHNKMSIAVHFDCNPNHLQSQFPPDT